MTRKALKEFRNFCAGYPNASVLEWLDDEIYYFDALYDVQQIREKIREEFFDDEELEKEE